jgi:thiol-disulfide isomerase/thioredoxin
MARPRLVSSLLALLLAAASALSAQQVPRKAGEFVIGMPGGKQLLLSGYRGKVVVLAAILTTCPHCQHTVQLLGALQNELGPRGLQVLACAVQEAPELAVPLFVKTYNPPFPVGFNADANAVLGFYQYDRNHLPHMPILAFIDRQGTIRAQHEGAEETFFGDPQQAQNLRTQIAALLKERAPGRTAAKKTGSR